MKLLINKRMFLVILLFVLAALWLVPTAFAGPSRDAGVPTFTPTATFTLPPPTAVPTATFTATPPPAPTQAIVVVVPSETPIGNDPGGSNAPETGAEQAAAAGSSVLGFLLCVGILIVAGLAALNIWSRRRP